MSLQMIEGTVDERLQRAVALKVDGQYGDAEAELRSILESEPDNPQARRELGLVLGFTGLFDESIAELRRAVQLNGGFFQARVDLALTLMMLGEYDEARKELETVLEMDPTNAAALRHIVYLR